MKTLNPSFVRYIELLARRPQKDAFTYLCEVFLYGIAFVFGVTLAAMLTMFAFVVIAIICHPYVDLAKDPITNQHPAYWAFIAIILISGLISIQRVRAKLSHERKQQTEQDAAPDGE